MSDFSPEEQELADAFAGVNAPAPVQGWRGRAPRRFNSRPDWVRPLAGVLALAVVGGGLGGYFGFRAATGGGTAGTSGPEARTAAAMAFDAANGTMVLFGGDGIHGPLGDTWTWDGSSWTQQHPTTSPPARGGSLMAYDANSHAVVLLGGTNFPEFGGVISSGSGYACPGVVTPTEVSPAIGSSGGAVPAETPPPNGSTSVLTPLPVPTRPLPACTPSPPDPNAPRVFLDTWVWDGGNWHQAASTPQELAGGETQIATDPVTGSVLAVTTVPSIRPLGLACPVPAGPPASAIIPDCGGTGFSVKYLAWRWKGDHWVQAPAPPPATSTAGYATPTVALVDDPSTGHLGLFREDLGGPMPPPCAVLAPATTGSPLPKSTPAVLPEPCLQQTNPPSGSPPSFSGSVAEWTGTAWTTGPAFVNGPALVPRNFAAVGDPAHHDVVFYLESVGETWAWTGTWTQIHSTTSPPFLVGAAAAYDGKSNQVVLFGGETQNGSGVAINDAAWVWDGARWLQRGGGNAVTVPMPTPQLSPPVCPKPSAKPPVGDALPACPPPTGTNGGGGAPGSAGGAAPATASAAAAG